MLAKEAVKMINSGLALQEMVPRLENARNEIKISFTVDDIMPLRRSGRLGLVRQSVGTILNIKPILKLVEGSIIYDGTARAKASK